MHRGPVARVPFCAILPPEKADLRSSPGPLSPSFQDRGGLCKRREAPRPLFQITAKPLDAPAGFLHIFGLGGVGNAKRGTEAERSTLHHRNAFGFQKLRYEIFVGRELPSALRDSPHGTGAGGIDIERAFRLGAMDAARLVEHGDAEVPALLEDEIVLG